MIDTPLPRTHTHSPHCSDWRPCPPLSSASSPLCHSHSERGMHVSGGASTPGSVTHRQSAGGRGRSVASRHLTLLFCLPLICASAVGNRPVCFPSVSAIRVTLPAADVPSSAPPPPPPHSYSKLSFPVLRLSHRPGETKPLARRCAPLSLHPVG